MDPTQFRYTVIGCLAVLIAGAIVSALLIWSAPSPATEEETAGAKIVQTRTVTPIDTVINVIAYGPVIPSRKVVVEPQVSGRIIRHHASLVPGGYIAEGEELVAIEPVDYELAVIEREAELEEARYQYEVEKGRQVVAQREWGALRDEIEEVEVNRSLVLREPHLRRTEAMVEKARNAIARAQLDLSRTKVVAPFNAMVLEESVEIGQLADSGSPVCTLIGTDEFWVQATVPISDLKRVRIPEEDAPGAMAMVFLDIGNEGEAIWQGTVVRLLSDLETTGRMARLLVKVDDPLQLRSVDEGSVPLLLGSYARVEIEVGQLQNVLPIPRLALREGDRIWVAGPDNTLRIRPAEVLWVQRDTVLVPNNLEEGERLIVSELKAALPGMAILPQSLDDGPTPTIAQEGPAS